jgi:glycosyltransferase involved in cell wall biosynthesis
MRKTLTRYATQDNVPRYQRSNLSFSYFRFFFTPGFLHSLLVSVFFLSVTSVVFLRGIVSVSSVVEPVASFCITDLDAGGGTGVGATGDAARSRVGAAFLPLGAGRTGDVLRSNISVNVSARALVGSAVWKLARRFKQIRPALVQSFLFHATSWAESQPGWRVCGVWFQGSRGRGRSRWPLWIDRATNAMVDRHVCVSEGVARFSIEQGRLPAQKVTVIPNGVDADVFRNAPLADLREFTIPVGSSTILFVGRLDPQKAPFLLLGAVKALLPARADLHVLFVGDGPLRPDLEAWVREHNLQTQIHFAGRRNDVAKILKAGTCLALPSRWEGMPNVVLEAMAAGLPVVAARVEGTDELISQHETGILVAPDSVPELAGALALLLSNREQAGAMGSAAQDHVIKEFTWERVVADYERLYRELLGR